MMAIALIVVMVGSFFTAPAYADFASDETNFKAGGDTSLDPNYLGQPENFAVQAINNARAVENSRTSRKMSAITIPDAYYDLNDDARILYLHNQARLDRGLDALAGVDVNVDGLAQRLATNLEPGPSISHTDPVESNQYSDKIASDADLAGGWSRIAENIASNFHPAGAHYEWMYRDGACCSWGHRDNILQPDFGNKTVIGVGKGTFSNGNTVYVVDFFKPNGSYSPVYAVTTAQVNEFLTVTPTIAPATPTPDVGTAVGFQINDLGSLLVVDSVSWDFGDGTNGTGEAPSHTYTTAGNYNVTATITTNAGVKTATTNVVAAIPVGPSLDLQFTGTGHGSGSGTSIAVTGGTSGDKGSCEQNCSPSFSDGETVNITVNTIHDFNGWAAPVGTCSGTTSPCSFAISSNTTLSADFSEKTYTITPTAGMGGSISPDTAVSVLAGQDQNFTFSPDAGYEVSSVHVNGTGVTPIPADYTFGSVASDGTIEVRFAPIQHEISFTIAGNGTVTDGSTNFANGDSVMVNQGADVSIAVTPAMNTIIEAADLQGTAITIVDRTATLIIPITNIQSDQILTVTFAELRPVLTVSNSSLNFGSVPINSSSPPKTLTIRNDGNQSLEFTSFNNSNTMFAIGGTCDPTAPLAPSATCVIEVTFAPGTSMGAQNGTLEIVSNDSNSPHSITFAGEGVTDAVLPVADFAVSTFLGEAPLTVDFTDDSQNSPTSWSWNFGGAGVSSAASPSFTFNDPGTYQVTLQATNAAGTSAPVTKTIEVFPTLQADFIANPLSIYQGEAVQFTGQSQGVFITDWQWDFGDGESSIEPDPQHTYNTAGTYSVTLTVINGTGSSVETKTNLIEVLPVVVEPINTGGHDINTTSGARYILQESDPATAFQEVGLDLRDATQDTLTVTDTSSTCGTGGLQEKGLVYQCFSIDLSTNDINMNLQEAKITFTVDSLWLTENGVDGGAGIQLYHRTTSADPWEALATENIGALSNSEFYESFTSGFSEFGIVGTLTDTGGNLPDAGSSLWPVWVSLFLIPAGYVGALRVSARKR